MVCTVHLEKNLFQNFNIEDNFHIVGLILGQRYSNHAYIFHLARIQHHVDFSKSDPNEFKDKVLASINDIDDVIIANHSKDVTMALPGGLCVLGIFIPIISGLSGPECSAMEETYKYKLISVLKNIHTNFYSNENLYGSVNHEFLILSHNYQIDEYICQSIDINKEIFYPTDLEFLDESIKWCHLETIIDLDHLLPVSHSSNDFRTLFKDTVDKLNIFLDSAIIVIDGQSRPDTSLIGSIGNENQNEKDKNEVKNILQCGVYLPHNFNKEQDSDILISYNSTFQLKGRVLSRVVVHETTMIKDAATYMKQDIIRSLTARIDVHNRSLLIEEREGLEDIALYKLPKRVLVELPRNNIPISDYYTCDNKPQDTVFLIKRLLNVDILEDDVQTDVEEVVNASELYQNLVESIYCQNKVKTISMDQYKESILNNQFVLYTAGIIAIIIAIFSILLYQLYPQK